MDLIIFNNIRNHIIKHQRIDVVTGINHKIISFHITFQRLMSLPDSEQPSESEEHEQVTPMEEFQALCTQYYAIIDETSPEFVRERQLIEDAHRRELAVIGNYWRAKLALIQQEGRFIQQLEDDATSVNA